MYSFRMSFWTVRRDVEGDEGRRRGVDRHRRRDLAERDLSEQDLHVGEARDRDADAADLAGRFGRVRVVAHLRRQVERHREARLALLEQVPEPAVRLLGGGEAGVLAHRPEPAPVHRRLDPAREGHLTRVAEVSLDVEARDVLGAVQVVDLDPGGGLERISPLGGAPQRRRPRRRSPALPALPHFGPPVS
jgi:hypothetical protein